MLVERKSKQTEPKLMSLTLNHLSYVVPLISKDLLVICAHNFKILKQALFLGLEIPAYNEMEAEHTVILEYFNIKE